jgi:hypothetical protein
MTLQCCIANHSFERLLDEPTLVVEGDSAPERGA